MHYHVVRSSTGTGQISTAQLNKQQTALQNAFGPVIQFASLQRHDYVDNNVFQNACNDRALMDSFKNTNGISE